MTNRIRELFDPLEDGDDDDEISHTPGKDDIFTITYHKNGLYAIHRQSMDNPGTWEPIGLCPLGQAIKGVNELERLFLNKYPEYRDVDTVWVDEVTEMVIPSREYHALDDLTEGEYYWWVECNQYGPYPGDDWYDQTILDLGDEWIDHLNK